jgi:hypothetical protein
VEGLLWWEEDAELRFVVEIRRCKFRAFDGVSG